MSDENDLKLITNIQDQLNRLMTQLADIEQEKETLEAEEYIEMKNGTMEQLRAIRAAISEAFKTPEIVAIFAKKQPALLRQKLIQAETDLHLRKISEEIFNARKAEIFYALLKMGAELNAEESDFLSSYSKLSSASFELAAETNAAYSESLVNVNM
ncbi:unnamed protein product [Anisakis simplex]|uniref:Protein LZIC n=1 Tax=Anisakis simplex TaxID=6269 RepID=A0A0M3JTB8_ANISI|nr:unnamed protein product [Anisakis simplex]